MADFKITIPILGKVLAYIYDFATYKKKWDLMIEFPKTPYKSAEGYEFSVLLTNQTSYHVKINDILGVFVLVHKPSLSV